MQGKRTDGTMHERRENDGGVVNIAVAGHVDHGKSTFTSEITAVISIKGHAPVR